MSDVIGAVLIALLWVLMVITWIAIPVLFAAGLIFGILAVVVFFGLIVALLLVVFAS